MSYDSLFKNLHLDRQDIEGGKLSVRSPIDGAEIARVAETPTSKIDGMIQAAHQAFLTWRTVPAPRRGEFIRTFGELLRSHKDDLAKIITLESGKILEEGRGEVQEMIDMCDFAVGLSRQLYGLTIASERPGHRMMEQWHPLGVVGMITPFNFPAAVWAWNAILASVCGNAMVWKPSEKTPLTAIACTNLFKEAVRQFSDVPSDLLQLIIGQREAGEIIVDHPLIPLISATGSSRMGKEVGPRVAARFGRCLLELGGNNAMILAPSADINLALTAILFSAVGTAGQRCTSLRRLFVHQSIYNQVVPQLKQRYDRIPLGSPLESTTLVGPLCDEASFKRAQASLKTASEQGGQIHGGQRVLQDKYPQAFYMQPAIVEMPRQTAIVEQETFAPILYVMPYDDFNEALALQNNVAQGLSSCVFTNDVREAECFLSASGSDCGIANVNIGPSGAEIGGAFGGEKETGGGRESGSDSWKTYMRRTTNTINYSKELPLAQGIKFNVEG